MITILTLSPSITFNNCDCDPCINPEYDECNAVFLKKGRRDYCINSKMWDEEEKYSTRVRMVYARDGFITDFKHIRIISIDQSHQFDCNEFRSTVHMAQYLQSLLKNE